VGKSTLFNRLYGRRYAITDSTPGVTRDAVAVEGEIGDIPVLLVDTGGIGEGEQELDREVYSRSKAEIARADVVLLLLDVMGITGEDEELIDLVRRSGRPAVLVVNKADNPERDQMVPEFMRFGIPEVVSISAAHGYGMDDLEDAILRLLPVETTEGTVSERAASEPETDEPAAGPVRLAIVGQPNTGKSSLLNRLVGEELAIVSEIAGTTRDVMEAEFRYKDLEFTVIDTAGIRRKSRVHESVEYYAVQRALDAIDAAELVVLIIDVTKGLTDQDKKIASRIAERGRGVVIALNKWDLLESGLENKLNAIVDRVHFLFPVFKYVPILPLSALTGEGIKPLLDRLVHVRGELHRRVDTGPLNQALQRWMEQTPPPSGKKPIKLRYMTQVSTNPVRFVLFVNRKKAFPEFYLRYIMNQVRQEFGFHHIPFFIEVR
jgi:GTP-binding protein